MKLILKITAGVLLALVLFSIPFVVHLYRQDQQRLITEEQQNSITAQTLANVDMMRIGDLQVNWVEYNCDKHPRSIKCSDLQSQLDTVRADIKQKIDACNDSDREFHRLAELGPPQGPMCPDALNTIGKTTKVVRETSK
jgi:hypothetical protein